MSIKNSIESYAFTRIIQPDGTIKTEWLEVFNKFPFQFMIGSGEHFQLQDVDLSESTQLLQSALDETWAIISQLPDDLANKIGYENAENIFHLDETGTGSAVTEDGSDVEDQSIEILEFEEVEATQDEDLKYIDVHTHLQDVDSGGYSPAAAEAISMMDKFDVQTRILMPPPMSPENLRIFDCDVFFDIISQNPGRFVCCGGGGTLNPMIVTATSAGIVSAEVRREFEEKAKWLITGYGAVGFGEFTALHISLGRDHPYIYVPPNHELFKLLVDIASGYDVPIDLHMEAVLEGGMDTPAWLLERSPWNPTRLPATIPEFQDLLAYAEGKARIIWDHLNWDNTGYRTVELCDELLSTYSCLYMSIRVKAEMDITGGEGITYHETGIIRPEWMELFEKHPTKFMMGADTGLTFDEPEDFNSFYSTWSIIDQFETNLRELIGRQNAIEVFNLAGKISAIG